MKNTRSTQNDLMPLMTDINEIVGDTKALKRFDVSAGGSWYESDKGIFYLVEDVAPAIARGNKE